MRTITEIMRETGLARRTVYKHIANGRIPAATIKRARRGNPLFKDSEYQREIARRREEGKRLQRIYKKAYKAAKESPNR